MLAGLVLRELLALRGGWLTAGTFRHGPLLDVGEGHGAIVIAGGRTADLGLRMAEDIAARGGRALHITNGAASTAAGVLSVALDVDDEAQFALLAILPVEHFLSAAAEAVGTRYVRVQTKPNSPEAAAAGKSAGLRDRTIRHGRFARDLTGSTCQIKLSFCYNAIFHNSGSDPTNWSTSLSG